MYKIGTILIVFCTEPKRSYIETEYTQGHFLNELLQLFYNKTTGKGDME